MPFNLVRLLKAEGLVEACVGLAAFAWTGESWWLFAALLLAPDVGMLGYLVGPRAGAVTYNLTHVTIGPALAALVGWWLSQPLAFAVAAIWLTHIGIDRALGYGLKSPLAFKQTHLGEIGAPCAS